MDAGPAGGTLTTRQVRFGGSRLFVNAHTAAGELRAEVLDAGGKVIAPFTKENCVPIKANTTLQPVSWYGAADLGDVAGRDVRFRFTLSGGGSLYAFWVSADASGASRGFVGAGGPGMSSHRDTVGASSIAGNRPPLVSAGVDQTVRAAAPGGAEVALDGSGTADPDGAVRRFEWRADNKPIATGEKATVLLPPGTHTLTLAVTDDAGATGYGGVRVNVLPMEDPSPPRNRLALWLKSDAIQGLNDGDAVAAWPDSSANGLDPFQADPAKRPVWRAKAVNDLPALRFDGADDHLRTRYYRDLFFASHKVSVFAVFKADGELGSRGLLSANWTALATTGEKGGGLVYTTAYTMPENRTVWTNVSPVQAGAIRSDRWTVGAVIRSGNQAGQTRLRVNGAANDDGTAIPFHSMNVEHGLVGCLRGATGCWKGHIAEVLVYGDALSDEDIQAVERYLRGKYAIGRPE